MSGYTGGDYDAEHQHTNAVEDMKEMSGEEGQDIVKRSFTVSLTALWQKLSSIWR